MLLAMWVGTFFAAITDPKVSGADVPTARIVTPITSGGRPAQLATTSTTLTTTYLYAVCVWVPHRCA